jgi:uncharacterized protein YhdP
VRTDNLKMHGVAATVLMDGTADIANESTNLRVVVIPRSTSAPAPLVYALAVNPVIGLGSFLAQLFLQRAGDEGADLPDAGDGPVEGARDYQAR